MYDRSAVDKLKVWLDKSPFKSQNTDLKKETFYAILNAVMGLKDADLSNLCGDKGSLNDKLGFALTKYLFAAMELIAKKDKRKYQSLLNSSSLFDV